MKRKLLNLFVLFFLAILINSCATRKSTMYSKIPKPIMKKIEYQHERYLNAFYYRIAFDYPNSFLFWYYDEQSTVHWFCYTKGRLTNKGTFESEMGARNLDIFEINNLLKVEFAKFATNNTDILDLATFGCVLSIYSVYERLYEEVIGWTYLSQKRRNSATTDTFIEKDLKKILDLNLKE
jgi:hypothetical protein